MVGDQVGSPDAVPFGFPVTSERSSVQKLETVGGARWRKGIFLSTCVLPNVFTLSPYSLLDANINFGNSQALVSQVEKVLLERSRNVWYPRAEKEVGQRLRAFPKQIWRWYPLCTYKQLSSSFESVENTTMHNDACVYLSSALSPVGSLKHDRHTSVSARMWIEPSVLRQYLNEKNS